MLSNFSAKTSRLRVFSSALKLQRQNSQTSKDKQKLKERKRRRRRDRKNQESPKKLLENFFSILCLLSLGIPLLILLWWANVPRLASPFFKRIRPGAHAIKLHELQYPEFFNAFAISLFPEKHL